MPTPYATLPDSLSVPTRWGGLEEAPSLDDTTLVCEGADQQFFALWRRHERASECVWIDQGNLTLRSGAVFDMQDFPIGPDPELAFGDPAEVAVAVECSDEDPTTSDEIIDLWLDYEQQWEEDFGTTTGVLAIHTKRLIDEDGDSCARGIAVTGDPALPWLAVSDPQDLCDQSGGDCQYNERSLAHEFGHVCSLGHVTTAGRLMVTGGDTSDTTLTQAEIDQCRDYIEDNASVFDFDVAPDVGADLVAALDAAPELVNLASAVQLRRPSHDAAFDDRDIDGAPGRDLRKVMVARSEDGGLDLHVLTAGLMEETERVEYFFALDIDNDPDTGASLAGVFGEDQGMRGVEWIGSVAVERAPRACTSIQPELRVATTLKGPNFDTAVTRAPFLAQATRFQEIQDPQFIATFRTACVTICDLDEGRDHRHVEAPFAQRLTMELPGELVAATGPLRVQIFSRDPASGEVDLMPNRPAVMTFERPRFPGMRLNPREARAGDIVQIGVAGMKPGTELHTILGATEIPDAGGTVGPNGRATLFMQVPAGTTVGPHLVTVGADVFTADDILHVIDTGPVRPPVLPGDRSLFELLVSYEDLLRRQAIQLDKFSDLIRAFEERTE